MSDSARMLEVLTEMRDLLRLMAEPAIAERDKKLRQSLRAIVGSRTGQSAKAVVLMDGSKTQTQIINQCGIHAGTLSTLVKKLKSGGLLVGEIKQPRLAILIPSNFFEGEETE